MFLCCFVCLSVVGLGFLEDHVPFKALPCAGFLLLGSYWLKSSKPVNPKQDQAGFHLLLIIFVCFPDFFGNIPLDIRLLEQMAGVSPRFLPAWATERRSSSSRARRWRRSCSSCPRRAWRSAIRGRGRPCWRAPRAPAPRFEWIRATS